MITDALIATQAQLDAWTMKQIERIDKMIRGTCQEDDCFERADVSEVRTSLAFCGKHYYERVRQMNLRVIRGGRHAHTHSVGSL